MANYRVGKFYRTGVPEFFDYPDCPEYDDEELARILNKYRGQFHVRHPEPGTPPSTEIHIWDIEVIAKLNRMILFNLMKGSRTKFFKYFGKKRRRRLSHYLYMIEEGYVTKEKRGRYVFHKEPVAKKVEMKLVFGNQGVQMVPSNKEQVKLPKVGKMMDILGILQGE